MIMAEADQQVGAFGSGKGFLCRSGGEGEGGHRLVTRPIASVPDSSRLGGAAAQSLSRNPPGSSSHVTRPDFVRPSWFARRQLQGGHSGIEENSTVVTVLDHSSLKKEAMEGSSTSTWDRPAPMGSGLDRREELALAQKQQARKAAFMYGRPLQALRAKVALSSALADEAQLGAHQSRVGLGAEPSSSHGAGTSGSPLPFYSRVKGDSRVENHVVQSPQIRQQQHIPMQGVIATAGPESETGKHPCTAQLTIFYAGMVNVYEDVPSDKAQAIMLLAGTGSAWSSSNYTNVRNGSAGANPAPLSTAGGMNHQPISRVGSSVLRLATPSPEPPSGAAAKLPTRQVTTAVELPQARKASLARFLEKRKDRVRKGPYTHPLNDEGVKKTSSRENSPSHADTSNRKLPLPRRSLSPPAAAAAGSETTSQPRTPPRQSTNLEGDRSHGKACGNCSTEDATTSRGEKSPFR